MYLKHITLISLFFLSLFAKPLIEKSDLKVFFENVDGSIFISHDNRYSVYNKKYIYQRFKPLNTFNIYSSLFALDLEIFRDKNSTMLWDKKDRGYIILNQNHDLKSALEYSVNWYFSELIEKIGKDNINKYLKLISYGNEYSRENLKTLWFDSKLNISMFEQFNLLRCLNDFELDFSIENIEQIKSLIFKKERNRKKLYALSSADSDLVWYIGYVESEKGNSYFVALAKDTTTFKLQKIVKEILRYLNIF